MSANHALRMVDGQGKQQSAGQKRKPTKKELEAEFDKLAQLLLDLHQKAKAKSLQQ